MNIEVNTMAPNGSGYNSPYIQDAIIKWHEKNCRIGFVSSSDECPEIWDGILCWPPTTPNKLAELSCPGYFAGFDTQKNATKQCMPDGQWYWSPENNQTWTNYTQCSTTKLVTVLMDVPKHNSSLTEMYLPIIRNISTIGYTVSLSTLVVAFCILATIKKLRCSRNLLHLHLFVSFMTRALMALLKNILIASGLSVASDIIEINGASYLHVNDYESNWLCKTFASLWQYFILANYSWILMEGLYLHNLVFFALFPENNSSIAGYVILGWGLPVIFVIPWAILRTLFDNTYCWFTNESSYIFFYMIRLPTGLSIIINFILFINIVRVLLLKLQFTISEETQRYKRWARSTLVLVPLFGVHYALFLGMSYSIGINEKVELIWLFVDQLFASFQGFFVAVLYCFLNGEVRVEVTRAFNSNRWSRLRRSQRTSTRSDSACSCQLKKIRKHKKRGFINFILACFCTDNSMHHRSSHSMMSTQQDIATRGCSLASSRVFFDSPGPGMYSTDNQDCTSLDSSACNRYTARSTLSFCSHMLADTAGPHLNIMTTDDRPNNTWSDTESCLALKLDDYPQLEIS
ncbi:hypothetical protein HCN44_009935 [Aphidius gifuensis]|uniref:Parathyroid hormone/parathyroid hormone-related peptide receptor n=1 Tax=Aphidius gifuensis TaxID=684658 RepID=A0A834XJX7_APHGI|nr:vasoactive intestinal polypeptide receptor 2 isoform X1 [Aphidius gifuensis]KAF7988290.1 hypothetical protein HCN44_009935 [Aphidius gifuensis]